MRLLLTPLAVLIGLSTFAQAETWIAGFPVHTTPEAPSGHRLDCDTISTLYPPFEGPTGLAKSGDEVWVADAFFSTIYPGDLENNWAEPLVLDGFLGALEYSDCVLYAVSEQSAQLYRIDPETFAYEQYPLPTFNPDDPNVFGVTFGDDQLWVSEYHGSADSQSRLYTIDPTTFLCTDTVFVDANLLAIEYCDGVIHGFDSSTADYYRIDPATGDILATELWCIGWPYDMELDGGSMWMASGPAGTGDVHEMTTNWGCDHTNTPCGQVGVSSIDAAASMLVAYPNPSAGMFQLNTPTGTHTVVRDATGRFVFSTQTNVLDLRDLPSGVYTAEQKNADRVQQVRLVKE